MGRSRGGKAREFTHLSLVFVETAHSKKAPACVAAASTWVPFLEREYSISQKRRSVKPCRKRLSPYNKAQEPNKTAEDFFAAARQDFTSMIIQAALSQNCRKNCFVAQNPACFGRGANVEHGVGDKHAKSLP